MKMPWTPSVFFTITRHNSRNALLLKRKGNATIYNYVYIWKCVLNEMISPWQIFATCAYVLSDDKTGTVSQAVLERRENRKRAFFTHLVEFNVNQDSRDVNITCADGGRPVMTWMLALPVGLPSIWLETVMFYLFWGLLCCSRDENSGYRKESIHHIRLCVENCRNDNHFTMTLRHIFHF